MTSRRALIRSSLLGACCTAGCRARQPVATPAAKTTLFVPVFSSAAAFPGPLWETLAVRFQEVLPNVRIRWAGPAPVTNPGLALIGGSSRLGVPYRPYGLADSIVDVSQLLPGLLAPYVSGNTTWAFPIALRPSGLRYNPQLAQVAGANPRPNWRWSDLLSACALVAADIAHGRVVQISSPLPLLIGQWAGTKGQRSSGEISRYPERWLGIVHGFGGVLMKAHRFTLVNPGVIEAFRRIIDLQRMFGLVPSREWFRGEIRKLTRQTAIGFGPGAATEANALYSPFVAMPKASPIPVAVTAIALVKTAAAPVPGNLVRICERLVDWVYAPAQQALMASYRVPPLSGDPLMQDRFWASQSSWPGLVPPGGFKRFSTGQAGLPAGTPLGDIVGVLNQYAGQAEDVAQLPSDLQRVETDLNTWLNRSSRRWNA